MELTPPSPTSPCAPGWGAGTHSGPNAHVEKCLSGGAHSYVTGGSRSVFPSPSSPSLASALFGSSPTSSDDDITSITPPPSYTTIYPPSPPSSAPSSPTSFLANVDAIVLKSFTNPLHRALACPSPPSKPVLSHSDSSSDSSSILSSSASSAFSFELDEQPATAAPSLLATIFAPASPVHDLPASVVDLAEFDLSGAVLDNPAMGTRTLYVAGGKYEDVNLRETVCGVLEKAEEELGCTGVVMCLEKSSPDLGDLLHSLMYVGGTITTGPYTPNAEYILVGLDV